MKLKEVVDGTIICTDGFRLFKDPEKCTLLRMLADSVGLIVLTDSDAAGLQIRNYIRSITRNSPKVLHLYIPKIYGKEHRKSKPSKEGTLGVEGMESWLLEQLLTNVPDQALVRETQRKKITKLDFYEDGFSGKTDSARRRAALCHRLQIPDYLSANALLEYLNTTMTPETYREMTKEIQ